MALTKAGLATRDWLVFDQCRRARLPVVVVMGADMREIGDTVAIQWKTVRIAAL